LRQDGTTTLWRALFGSRQGLIGVHSTLRPRPGSGRLESHRPSFFAYPERAFAAARWCLRRSDEGLEAYFCAHLLTRRRRTKENAAPVVALWADADGGRIPPGAPEPTAIVETSPGRAHLFWSLRRPVPPRDAEELNRRLLLSVGADRSGWDLSQLLRPPGTLNRKYAEAPEVRLLELDEGTIYHPRELEQSLPEAPDLPAREDSRAPAPRKPPPSPIDLTRLSTRARALVRLGNAGAGSPYPSRSEADFAVCLAMFGAGYGKAEVRAVMTDPANGISERTLEKGPHAEGYLALTIGKASEVARPRALGERRRGTSVQE
jgi:hypothetical protein